MGFWYSNCSILNPFIGLVHFIWNQSKIREFNMRQYGSLNGSIFTFSTASDLRFSTHSWSFCVHCMMCFWGLKVRICKMMTSHFTTLYDCASTRSSTPSWLCGSQTFPLTASFVPSDWAVMPLPHRAQRNYFSCFIMSTPQIDRHEGRTNTWKIPQNNSTCDVVLRYPSCKSTYSELL